MRLLVALALFSQLLSCQSDVDISIVDDDTVVETDKADPTIEVGKATSLNSLVIKNKKGTQKSPLLFHSFSLADFL